MKYLHGTIIIQPDGHITLTNGCFDCEGAAPPNHMEAAQAALNLVLTRFLALPGVSIPAQFQSQPSESTAIPMPMQLEREAEMEAYLLINRCQGNG